MMLNNYFKFFLLISSVNQNYGFAVPISDECGVNSERLEYLNSNAADARLDELKNYHVHEIIRKKRCEKSVSVFNGKQAACKGDIIFEEDFNQKVTGDSPDNWAFEDNFTLLNSSVWKREVKIPQQPDYEFCVYHKLAKNIKIDNGVIKIIPTMLEDEFGENIVYFGRLQLAACNGLLHECSRNATSHSILPPIISARLTTKNTFTFHYGKIEIRAKFPKGDWLFPEMRLHSTADFNNRITLGMARGNDRLHTNDEPFTDFSSNQLEFEADYVKFTKSKNSESWNNEFHVYTTIWTEHGIIFEVDSERIGGVPRSGYSVSGNNDFNRDFYLILGLGVGGIKVFPDRTRSNYEKPWRNVEAKAMLRFWQTKDQWLPTWRLGTKQTAALEIDYVKIFAV